ncbi:hypothetical protein [Epilithonimonas sp.]|uniref:hypothetical protein n=1 Tax=Epilithonimonas sp. TaxID=2894511 RepID=UPI002897F0B7|nr:hypothetical protein [Epilithonimonas sp.]
MYLGKNYNSGFYFAPYYRYTNVVGRPKSGIPLSAEDQENILEEVNGFDIPIIKYEVDADSKEVRVKIDGPWAGLRSGLSFGYRF